MIDSYGFRPNVGIIIGNGGGRVLWARRIGQTAWQFPQGGIKASETAEQALYRELEEEVGLAVDHVRILGRTEGWLRYRLPPRLIRRHRRPVCIGQKQIWFMLQLVGDDRDVRLDRSGQPEFDDWRWVDYWEPVQQVVFFKRRVYDLALSQLAPLLFPEGVPDRPVTESPERTPLRRRR